MINITEKYRKNRLDEIFLERFNLSLANLEKEYIDSQKPSNQPLIFVCGAPRSGTTLLTQVLAKTGHFNYIDNFIARFWRAPYIGLYIESLIGIRKNLRNVAFSFKSDFGRTPELLEPHEFRYFWEYWLKPDIIHHVIPVSHLKKIDIDGLRKEINAMLNFYNQTLFFKNIWFLSNPLLAYKIFNNVYFIFLKRDLLSNTLSILNARRKYHGDENVWFSVKPLNYQEIKNKPVEFQIVQQIKSIYDEIKRQSKKFPDKVINISYEELCKNPISTVLKITEHIGLKSVDSTSLQKVLPEKFNLKNKASSLNTLKRFEKLL